MKAYLILDFCITDRAGFMEYVEGIPACIQKHDGKYLVEGIQPELIEGRARGDTLVVLEFPSEQKAKSFLSDPETKRLFAIRHRTTQGSLILALGGSWRELSRT